MKAAWLCIIGSILGWNWMLGLKNLSPHYSIVKCELLIAPQVVFNVNWCVCVFFMVILIFKVNIFGIIQEIWSTDWSGNSVHYFPFFSNMFSDLLWYMVLHSFCAFSDWCQMVIWRHHLRIRPELLSLLYFSTFQQPVFWKVRHTETDIFTDFSLTCNHKIMSVQIQHTRPRHP